MVHVLWDASDIWGPLAVWGLNGLGVPYRIVRASEVADGVLTRERPSLLLVPGGFGRHKFRALGDAGAGAVKEYVRKGGVFLGFCGGAGLALADAHGLGLCPRGRGGYASRVQHYMSGHFSVTTRGDDLTPPEFVEKEEDVFLPVWWPGRFSPGGDDGVTVLASYDRPGQDFWLADLPVAALPPETFDFWENEFGFVASPSFLHGEPCVVRGTCGDGQYVLAYSHLETPASPDANRWLAHILRICGEEPRRSVVPAWDLRDQEPVWRDPDLADMWRDLQSLVRTGLRTGLFFERSAWLMGWRTGIPGAVLNTVRAHLHTIRSLEPTTAAARAWSREKRDMRMAFHDFARQAERYLLSERLSMTLAKDLPEGLGPDALQARRLAVFGSSGMTAHAGGLLGPLLPVLDEIACLQLRR